MLQITPITHLNNVSDKKKKAKNKKLRQTVKFLPAERRVGELDKKYKG